MIENARDIMRMDEAIEVPTQMNSLPYSHQDSTSTRNVSLDEEIVGSEATLLGTLINNFKSTYSSGPAQINPKALLDALLMMIGDYQVPGGASHPSQMLIDMQNRGLDEWGRAYSQQRMIDSPQQIPYIAPKEMKSP